MSLLFLAFFGCTGAPTPVLNPGEWTPAEREQLLTLRLDTSLQADPTNRWGEDAAAARFGQSLFFDAGLTPSGTVACVSCHRSDRYFEDGQVLSRGVGVAGRHTPTVVGSQFGPWQFWDGRVDSQWAQALGPIENPDEMGSNRMFLARQVIQEYGPEYQAIFGELPDFSDASRFPEHAMPGRNAESEAAWQGMSESDRQLVNQTVSDIGKAIAAYERRLMPQEAPFDRYLDALEAGTPSDHLDESQIRGLSLFLREGNCVSCHNGPLLTDRGFHNLGLPEPKKGYDAGRQTGAALVAVGEFNCESPFSDAKDCPELRYLNPQFPDFQSAFKTPSLRQVAETAPYMHHGELATLEDVLVFYSDLPGEPASGHRELILRPLHFSPEQRQDLAHFLESLTGGPLPAELLQPPP